MRRPTISQAAAGGLLGVATVRVVSELRLVLVAPGAELIRRTPDDTWYYLTVARNLAGGHGPTFDGHDRTNGFQPLWQGIEAVLAFIWHGTALARASFVTGQLLTVAAVALALLVVSRVVRLGPVGVGLVAVVVASPPVWSRLNDGMETPTVVLTVALLAAAIGWWWGRPTVARFGLVGVATGLCCLARTSTVLVVLLVPVVLFWFGPRARGRRVAAAQAAGWLGGLAVLCSPWFIWSWLVIGSPVQVSSRVKWHWARAATGAVWSVTGLRHAWEAMTEELWRQVRLGFDIASGTPSLIRRIAEVAGVALLVWLVVRLVRRSRRSLIVVVPAAVLVARVVVEFVTLPTEIATWYAAPLLVVGAIAAGALAAGAARWLMGVEPRGPRNLAAVRGGMAALVFALGIGVAVLPSGRPSGTWGVANLEAGRELARLPGRAGAFDAGVVGWTHPGTVNLDGLMRSPVSVDRLLRTPAPRVALDDHIIELVGRMRDDDPRIPRCARVIWTAPTDVFLPGQGTVPVRIWSLSGCGQ